MSINVTELEKRINSMVALDADYPTEASDDWNLYLMYLNMSQQDWQEAYEWPSLFKEVNTMTSQSTGLATISMPGDFRKVDGYLKIASSESVTEYPQIEPQKKSLYKDDEKYFYLLGHPGAYSMVVNPASHGSGASIYYSYWANAASLASPTDVSMCPDPNFLVQRSIAYLWEARDDGRFPQAKAESEKILQRMLEFEVTKGHSFDNRVQTYEETQFGFRIGRN